MSCIDHMTCEKVDGKSYKARITICGRCPEVKKGDLSYLVLGYEPIYLRESNRNKSGRHHKLTANQINDAKRMHKEGKSYQKIADYFNKGRPQNDKIVKTTIFNAIHGI